CRARRAATRECAHARCPATGPRRSRQRHPPGNTPPRDSPCPASRAPRALGGSRTRRDSPGCPGCPGCEVQVASLSWCPEYSFDFFQAAEAFLLGRFDVRTFPELIPATNDAHLAGLGRVSVHHSLGLLEVLLESS